MNVRTLCLGILRFGEASGYEIRKLASEGRFSHFIEAGFGSIYPALNRLSDEGLVTWREEREPGKPAKKIYAITERGLDALADELQTLPRPDLFKSETLFTTLFADMIEPDHLRRILDAYRAQHVAEIERLETASGICAHPGTQFAIQYGLAINRAAVTVIDGEGPRLRAAIARDTEATTPMPRPESEPVE